MKHPFYIIRICLAIILTLAIGLLPHHHHHGEICWGMERHAQHQHSATPSEEDCPSDPCSDSSCYILALKTFIQADHDDSDFSNHFLATLTAVFLPKPILIHFPTFQMASSCHLLPRAYIKAISRRGPPLC